MDEMLKAYLVRTWGLDKDAVIEKCSFDPEFEEINFVMNGKDHWVSGVETDDLLIFAMNWSAK